VPVPQDDKQRIYVWFDALNIYQSGVGFGWDEDKYKKWWPADVQVIGKGILRFHAVYWPAFLLSAALLPPKSILVHGYFTVDGQKMSKTVGNVIDPNDLIKKYGADALRYYLLAKFSPFTDGDFSENKLKDAYNGDLANGLGNLVSRVAKLCDNSGLEFPKEKLSQLDPSVDEALGSYRFDEAIKEIFELFVSSLDSSINAKEPWRLKGKKLEKFLIEAVSGIRNLAFNLRPFLPETAEKIEKQFSGPKIKSEKPLFPRL
jgi:methionyl-tRNA synthetase